MQIPSVPWGVPAEDTALDVWDLEADDLLPATRVTDVVHKTIYLNRLECKIIGTAAFQRLRRVRQLGMAHLVYPSATHTRFSHSVGVLHVAQQLINAVFAQHSLPTSHRPEMWIDDWGLADRVAKRVSTSLLGGAARKPRSPCYAVVAQPGRALVSEA